MVTIRNFNVTVTFDDEYATTTTVKRDTTTYGVYLLRVVPSDGHQTTTQLDWPARKLVDSNTNDYQSQGVYFNSFNNGVEFGTQVTVNHWDLKDPASNLISNADIGDSCIYLSSGNVVLYITGNSDEVFDNGFDHELYIGAGQGSSLFPLTNQPFVVALPSAVTSDSNFTQFFQTTPTVLIWDGSGFYFAVSPGSTSSVNLFTGPSGSRSRFVDGVGCNYPAGNPSLAAITSAFSASPNANGSSEVTIPRGGKSSPMYASAIVPTGGSATLHVAEVTDSGFTESSYPLILTGPYSGSEDFLELYLGPNGAAADYDDEQNALQSTTYLMVWWVESANATEWTADELYGLDISGRRYIPHCPESTVIDVYNGVVADGTFPALDSDSLQ